VLFVACGRGTREYALVEQSRPFSDLNKAKAGAAPPVVRAVTPQRLANARAEPLNWLTYHGAYDGQRFSPLDQINTCLEASSCSSP
jgi:alcohol dehydrogenase (cytochrome c)